MAPAPSKSPQAHRVVVAAVMVVVLGVVTVMAAWMASQGQTRRRPPLRMQSFPSLELLGPSRWPRVELPEPVGGMEPLAAWAEEPGGRTLSYWMLESLEPITPEVVRAAAIRWLTSGPGQITGGAALRSPMMIGRLSLGVTIDQDRAPQRLVLAVLTADGRRHVVVHLTGPGAPTQDDYALVHRIAASTSDRAYRPAASPVQIDSLALDLPEGRHALRTTGLRTELLIAPALSADFYALRLDAVELSQWAGQLREALSRQQVPPNLAAALDPQQLRTPDDRLAALLALEYWRQTGRPPPPFGRIRMENRVGFTATLSPPRSPTFWSMWAVRLDDDRAVLMELVAEPARVRHVHEAALLVLRGMGMEPQLPPETQQMIEHDESTEPRDPAPTPPDRLHERTPP